MQKVNISFTKKDINVKELYDTLDEEVDIYSISNYLDDETENELRFIINSFSKYFVNMCSKFKVPTELTYLDIVDGFETSLDAMSSGILGTGFKTEAINLYKKLPTFEAIVENGKFQTKDTSELKKEVESLKSSNKKLQSKIDDLEDTLSKKASRSSSSSAGSCGGGSTSYGGCGGGTSRSYGRC